MANTAMMHLEGQIKAIRDDAYNAGFAAAMRAIRDFVGGPSGAAATRTRVRKPVPGMRHALKSSAPKPRSRRSEQIAKVPSRPQRSRAKPGSNALLIAEVLKGIPHSTRAAEIRRALQRDKGVSISFAAIRYALDQLARRGEVETSPDHKTWRYAG